MGHEKKKKMPTGVSVATKYPMRSAHTNDAFHARVHYYAHPALNNRLFKNLNKKISTMDGVDPVPHHFFFNFLGACRRRTPRTRVGLKVPKDASHRDLSDATPRSDLAPRAFAVGGTRKVVENVSAPWTAATRCRIHF